MNRTSRPSSADPNGLGSLLAIPTVVATEFLHWRPDQRDGGPRNTGTTTTACNGQEPLSEVERRFLKAVLEHPGEPSSAYARYVGVSSRRATEVRNRLVGQGYLREHRVNTSARGRTAIVLELCSSAHEVLQATGDDAGGER